jgi:deoxyribonuclease-4
MILGGHVSSAGGPLKALDRAEALEFETVQIHPSSPQTWARPQISPEVADAFQARLVAGPVRSAFFHHIYLVNFASPNPTFWHASIDITKSYLSLADTMGVTGTVTHLGSHKGTGLEECLPRITEGLTKAVKDTPGDSLFIIENTAGAGGTIGRSLEEINRIVDELEEIKPRLGICIDTCHSFASGIPLDTESGLEHFLTEFEERFGLSMLSCIHLNDSQFGFNTNRDRHANIGEGFFGEEGFRRLFHHPKLQTVPFIMEVPGENKSGPDALNRDRVRALAA